MRQESFMETRNEQIKQQCKVASAKRKSQTWKESCKPEYKVANKKRKSKTRKEHCKQ